jgi:protein TonB
MNKQSSGYTEMLFENRNKEYGAYDLRVNYDKRLMRSFFLALLIAALLFLIPYGLTKILTQNQGADSILKTLTYDLSKTYVIEKPVKVKSVPSPIHKSLIANTTFKVAAKVEERKIEEQKSVDQGSHSPNGIAGTTADSSVTDGSNFVADSIPTEVMSIASVDVPPSFPGGENAMMKFLKQNLKFTSLAFENEISGKVYVSFVIDEKGRPVEISILKSLGYGMDEEVVRVVGMMPIWTPGRFHGHEVKTALILPVSFNLK